MKIDNNDKTKIMALAQELTKEGRITYMIFDDMMISLETIYKMGYNKGYEDCSDEINRN